MRRIDDIRYADRDNCFLDILLPESEEFDLIIWFHGGSLTEGSRKTTEFAQGLLEKGVAVVSPDYRLYPDAKFPDFLFDAADAVKYTIDNIGKYGKVKRIYISGSSAGGYISLMLALDNRYFSAAGVDADMITGYLSDSAQTTTHFSVLKERGLDERLERIDDAAVLYYLNENSKFGEMLLVYYTDDIPCRPEQNKLLYQSIKRFFPESRAELVELPGGHTHGTTQKNSDGTYDFTKTLIRVLNI